MKSLDDIQAMLDVLPSKEWRFDSVSDENGVVTGALRTMEGRNIIEPNPESASMVRAYREVADFLAEAPQIVQQLLDVIEHNEALTTSVKAPEKPKTGATTPISA